MPNIVHVPTPSVFGGSGHVLVDTDHPTLQKFLDGYVDDAVDNACDAITVEFAPIRGDGDDTSHTIIMNGPVMYTDEKGYVFYTATLRVLSSEPGMAEAVALQLKAVVLGVLFPYHVRELSRQYYSPTGILAAEHLMQR